MSKSESSKSSPTTIKSSVGKDDKQKTELKMATESASSKVKNNPSSANASSAEKDTVSIVSVTSAESSAVISNSADKSNFVSPSEKEQTKKLATGGANKFDLNLGKATAQGSSTDVTPTNTVDVERPQLSQRDERVELLRPGPGLLNRAQDASKTKYGCMVQKARMDHLLTAAEQVQIRSKPMASRNIRILLNEPFNLLSVVTEYLGLTGAGGLVLERFAQFPKPIGCVINVSYEAPLLKLDKIEAYRVPVEDDKKENLSIYFDEVTAKLNEMERKKCASVVHCMAGVSRSATFVLAYLIRYHKMSLEKAFRRTKNARTVINPNLGFLEQLEAYEAEQLPKEKRTVWRDHTENGITKRMPQFIIQDYLDEYEIEFEDE